MTKNNGPSLQRNWLAFESGATKELGSEYPLFTDAHVIGEDSSSLGPYKLINGRAWPANQERPIQLLPGVVFRIDIYELNEDVSEKLKSTDFSSYHGGQIQDEMAALLSLLTGRRFKAGGISRVFFRGDDPEGTPFGGEGRPLELPYDINCKPVIPNARGECNIENQHLLQSVCKIDPTSLSALMVAARLYQQALWVCDESPEQSWLHFVSAIERAANSQALISENPPESVKLWNEKLYHIVSKLESTDQEMAFKILAPISGSTRKFVSFLTTYGPPVPHERPTFAGLDWRKENLNKAFKTIYALRSKALHEGTPFPMPICQPPYRANETTPYVEIPIGIASATNNASWQHHELPMHLHVFEYIVRYSLINWWQSLATNS
ncbi:MAG: hypothetical protein JST12_03355 [Armatimonadetes bacterium]|nr:hypothetical protein [Armatimonadota bacterium]